MAHAKRARFQQVEYAKALRVSDALEYLGGFHWAYIFHY